MSDDSGPMTKALELGRTMFPMQLAPKPFPRDPILVSSISDNPETFEEGRPYKVFRIKDGWRYTYHHAKPVPSSAGLIFLFNNPELFITADFIGEPETAQAPAG